MTLTQITKIRGPGIHTTSNIVSHNINSSGIITAVAFKGPFTGSSNIQSGILTATKIDLNGDIDVDGHTNLDNVNVAGVTTTAGLLNIDAGGQANTFKVEDLTDNRVVIAGTGGELEDSGNLTFDGSTLAVTGGASFSGNVSVGGTLTYEDVTNIDSVGIVTARNGLRVTGGTSIFTGNTTFNGTNTFAGNSTVSGNYLDINDGKKLRLGTDGDCAFYYNGSATLIETGNKIIHMQSDASIRLQRNSPQQHMLVANAGGSVDLYHSGTQRFGTTNTGAVVTGILTATSDIKTTANLYAAQGHFTDHIYIADTIVHTGDTNTKIRFPTNDTVTVETAGDERLRIDPSGRLLVNTPNPINTSTSKFQVASNDANGSAILARFNANSYSSYLDFYKSRSNTLGTAYVVNNNDHLGAIRYYAADGSNSGYTTAAEIYGSCDGGSGASGDMPGRITFHTRPDGAGQSMQERLRIDSNGHLKIGTASAAGGRLYFESTSGAAQYIASGGTNNQDLLIANSAGEKLRIDSSGNVMIGSNTSGGWKLRVQVPANASYQSAFNITNNVNADLNFEIKNSESRFGPSTNTPLVIKNGGGERLRINSTGELGIGVAAASGNQLHIKNGGTADAFAKIESESGYDAALLLDTSNGGGASADVRFQMDGSTKGSIQYVNNASSADANSMLFRTGNNSTKMQITTGGNVNIGGNYTQTTYTMRVTGSFAATTKSFVIDHPTKENHRLRYACLEGPENSVYVRGRSSDSVIELPDYWVGLVHDGSITVNVTPIGNKNVWVESINNNSVTIGSDDSTEYFYTVFAERKDVEKLEVEVEK